MDVLKNAINCCECKNVLNQPVNLPCGHSICLIHINNPDVETYFCKDCETDNEIFNASLYRNHSLQILISANIQKLYLGLDYHQTYNTYLKLNNLLDEINNFTDDPSFFIHELIGKLKNFIDLTREQGTISNERALNVINQLDQYQKCCLNSLLSNDCKTTINDLITHSSRVKFKIHFSWNHHLMNFSSSLQALRSIKQNMQDNWFKLKHDLTHVKKELLLGKINQYLSSVLSLKGKKLSTNIKYDQDFANFYELVEFNLNDSKILGKNSKKKLTKLCEFESLKSSTLLYRASEDGFEAHCFHTKCDDVPNTLTIIKSTTGNVFGGFTTSAWNKNGLYESDSCSFIFSLINKHKQPIKLNISEGKSNYSIFCHANKGPVFGGGHDFCIVNNSNIKQSNSNLGHSYSHPNFTFGSRKAKAFLAGAANFLVTEIEVYKIVEFGIDF